MIGMKIFLDISFFVSFLRGEGQAKEIYEKIRSEELHTSLNVVEETTYILKFIDRNRRAL